MWHSWYQVPEDDKKSLRTARVPSAEQGAMEELGRMI